MFYGLLFYLRDCGGLLLAFGLFSFGLIVMAVSCVQVASINQSETIIGANLVSYLKFSQILLASACNIRDSYTHLSTQIVILSVLLCSTRRKNLCLDCCEGRPGLYS